MDAIQTLSTDADAVVEAEKTVTKTAGARRIRDGLIDLFILGPLVSVLIILMSSLVQGRIIYKWMIEPINTALFYALSGAVVFLALRPISLIHWKIWRWIFPQKTFRWIFYDSAMILLGLALGSIETYKHVQVSRQLAPIAMELKAYQSQRKNPRVLHDVMRPLALVESRNDILRQGGFFMWGNWVEVVESRMEAKPQFDGTVLQERGGGKGIILKPIDPPTYVWIGKWRLQFLQNPNEISEFRPPKIH